MLLLLSVILGLVFGLIKKGRLEKLVALRGLWLPILSFLATAVIGYLPEINLLPKIILTCFSYLCVIIFALINLRGSLLSCLLIGLGSLCNFVVIAVNSFRMPISEGALAYYSQMTAEAVLETRADYFVAVDGRANLLFLGDIICVPITGIGGYISLGDILLAFGVLFLIYFSMTRTQPSSKRAEVDLDNSAD